VAHARVAHVFDAFKSALAPGRGERDVVADAYAALLPKYGFRPLIDMLVTACDRGIDAVPDAPAELVTFIAAMEATPDWVDMDMVREGAALELNGTANLAPFAIRGAFIATFLNKYSALPMALTGTLGHSSAARRVNETDLLLDHRAAGCPRTPWRGVQGGGDGAADALDGAHQRAALG